MDNARNNEPLTWVSMQLWRDVIIRRKDITASVFFNQDESITMKRGLREKYSTILNANDSQYVGLHQYQAELL